MKVILPLLLVSFVSGCALFPKAETHMVRGVEKYCETVMEGERKAIRHRLNATLSLRARNTEDPPQVKGIHCTGDAK